MAKGKQVGLRLKPDEVERLNIIMSDINEHSDTTASDVLREFLGLRPRKVTTEDHKSFFCGQTDKAPNITARRGDKIEVKPKTARR